MRVHLRGGRFPATRHSRRKLLASSLDAPLLIVARPITHRRHAVIETTFADLIAGPLAHAPSASFAANSAWAILTAMTHNLLRAAGTLAGQALSVALGATLRRHLVNAPARITRPRAEPTLRLPAHWPHALWWNKLWDHVFDSDTAVQVAA